METLPTPTLLVDEAKLRANIDRVQSVCTAHGVALWPHIKTHKTVEIARMQLKAGATGLVCAKLGEAEVMLASGARQMFIAYPLVDPVTQAPRLRRLAESLDTLYLAATSIPQAEALGRVLTAAEITLPILMGVDTGLGREGARGNDDAYTLADIIRRHPHMRLAGMFTHEGHAYRESEDPTTVARAAVEQLTALRDSIDSSLTLWPGCSVTATIMATLPGVSAIRPGTYVFGDLSLPRRTRYMTLDDIALNILTTVVDRPQPGLALVDGGSKTFSSDKNPEGISASLADGRDLHITRLSEEHGFATGTEADSLRIGERLRWVPAHVCPTVNLTDELTVIRNDEVVDRWRVAARGKVQ
jgi:D-serine deaminase-like pyridoxal phosphate-dependent protein